MDDKRAETSGSAFRHLGGDTIKKWDHDELIESECCVKN